MYEIDYIRMKTPFRGLMRESRERTFPLRGSVKKYRTKPSPSVVFLEYRHFCKNSVPDSWTDNRQVA